MKIKNLFTVAALVSSLMSASYAAGEEKKSDTEKSLTKTTQNGMNGSIALIGGMRSGCTSFGVELRGLAGFGSPSKVSITKFDADGKEVDMKDSKTTAESKMKYAFGAAGFVQQKISESSGGSGFSVGAKAGILFVKNKVDIKNDKADSTDNDITEINFKDQYCIKAVGGFYAIGHINERAYVKLHYTIALPSKTINETSIDKITSSKSGITTSNYKYGIQKGITHEFGVSFGYQMSL